MIDNEFYFRPKSCYEIGQIKDPLSVKETIVPPPFKTNGKTSNQDLRSLQRGISTSLARDEDRTSTGNRWFHSAEKRIWLQDIHHGTTRVTVLHKIGNGSNYYC